MIITSPTHSSFEMGSISYTPEPSSPVTKRLGQLKG